MLVEEKHNSRAVKFGIGALAALSVAFGGAAGYTMYNDIWNAPTEGSLILSAQETEAGTQIVADHYYIVKGEQDLQHREQIVGKITATYNDGEHSPSQMCQIVEYQYKGVLRPADTDSALTQEYLKMERDYNSRDDQAIASLRAELEGAIGKDSGATQDYTATLYRECGPSVKERYGDLNLQRMNNRVYSFQYE